MPPAATANAGRPPAGVAGSAGAAPVRSRPFPRAPQRAHSCRAGAYPATASERSRKASSTSRGSCSPSPEGAQAADEEQQLAQRRLLLHRGEPLGRLQHRHARRVAGIVPGQRLAVGPDHLRLRDHVQRAPGVQHQVDVGERLEPGAEPRLGPADALGHGADPPAPAEDGNDPVRFAQLLRPQHDPVIPVELHLPIVACWSAGDPRGSEGWVPPVAGVPGVVPPGQHAARPPRSDTWPRRFTACQPRRDRFTADRTARIEAVTVFVSMPTPQKTWPPISHSTYAAAWASVPSVSACSV